MVKVRLRQCKSSDVKGIQRIAKVSGYFSLKDIKTIKDSALTQGCLIATVNSRPAGFIVFNTSRLRASISYIAVKDRFQGLGLGGRLLKAAERRMKAKKARKVLLHTFGYSGDHAPFYKVRDFYHRHGFQRLREIPNGFMNGVDKLVMVKEFA